MDACMVKRFDGCGGIVIHWTFCPSCFVNEAGCSYDAIFLMQLQRTLV